MDIKKTLEIIKEKYGNISWYMFSPFYADTEGTVCDTGIILFCKETTFHCYSDTVDTSFNAIDVISIQHAKKENVLKYVCGKTGRLKYMGTLPSLFADSLDVVDFEDNKSIFLKIKGTEFKQVLKIASCKQKYSMEEYNRSKNQF